MVSVFVPSHITGFFQVVDHNNPLKKGSRGAGIVINRGVTTTVKSSNKTKIDGLETIAKKVIEVMKRYYNIGNIKVKHEIDVPIGCGLGVSGACALGTAIGIAKELKLPITLNQAADFAHLAEVELKTGLGDVIAELSGGLVIRTREGAPSYGKIDKIIVPSLYVIIKVLDKINTPAILKDKLYLEKINKIGEKMLKKILIQPSLKNFLNLSSNFSKKISIVTPEIKDIMDIMNEETIGSSVAMLGKTIFGISETPETSLDDVIIAKIDFTGARIL